jgi:hypothetical protein
LYNFAKKHGKIHSSGVVGHSQQRKLKSEREKQGMESLNLGVLCHVMIFLILNLIGSRGE